MDWGPHTKNQVIRTRLAPYRPHPHWTTVISGCGLCLSNVVYDGRSGIEIIPRALFKIFSWSAGHTELFTARSTRRSAVADRMVGTYHQDRVAIADHPVICRCTTSYLFFPRILRFYYSLDLRFLQSLRPYGPYSPLPMLTRPSWLAFHL